MKRSEHILQELQEISPVVAEINPLLPYQVPEVYFDTLSSVIMARIATGGHEENSLLLGAGRQMPQEVPDGYFENLAGSILAKINTTQEQSVEDELKELSPIVAGISKTNVYEVPAGYFQELGTTFTAPKKETKVVALFSKKVWMQLAAAAVVFTMIAFGTNFFSQKSTTSESVATDDAVPPATTEKQFNNELATLSDDAIISYLKLTADAKDIEKISESIDHNTLPEESDYMDDVFLDSLMKELEHTETITLPEIETDTK
jgi:hypothetical protein